MKKILRIKDLSITVDIEGDLPEGSEIKVHFPITNFTQDSPKIEEPTIQEPPVIASPPEIEEPPIQEPIVQPSAIWTHGAKSFDAANSDYKTIGNVQDLNISGHSFTVLMRVAFPDLDKNKRMIGSDNMKDAGSSLQLGVLSSGYVWLDTFKGAVTGGKIEPEKEYVLGYSLDKDGNARIYIDGILTGSGKVPTFTGTGNLYLGRWINNFSTFDLKWVTIYGKLSDDEIKELIE